MTDKDQTTPHCPRAALGRGDLLRLLVLWGEGGEAAAGRFTGYLYEESMTQPQPAKAEAEAAAPAASRLTAAAANPAPARRACASHYGATLIKSDAMVSPPTPQTVEPMSDQPDQDEQTLLAATPPAWLPLSTVRRLTVLAENQLRHRQPVKQLDVGYLLRQAAQGNRVLTKKQVRKARLQRLRWDGNALVIHMCRQTEALHDDYRMLAEIVRRRSGGRVPVYLHYQGHGWAIYDPAPGGKDRLPRLWRGLAGAPPLAGMGGMALGLPIEGARADAPWPAGWSARSLLLAWLPDDGAPQPNSSPDVALPALVCWDLDSKLQPRRRLPRACLQTAPERLADLLALLTLAVVVHPPLLRALRCLLFLPAAAEAQAWSSPDVGGNGVAIAVRVASREAHLARLATLPLATRQRAAVCINAHHARLSSAIIMEEAHLAELHAPDALPTAKGYFTSLTLELRQRAGSGAAAEWCAELSAYMTRAGHRTDQDDWARDAEFELAWGHANLEALETGDNLPASFPLARQPALYAQVAGHAHPAQGQGVRLRQQDGFLYVEPCSAQDVQDVPEAASPALRLRARLGVDVLAQWNSAPLLKWRSCASKQWRPAALAQAIAPIDLAVYAPLEVSDGQTICIVLPMHRPAWALEWGRGPLGVYALAPNPWGAPVPVAHPLADAALPQTLFQTMPAVVKGKKRGARLDGLTLGLDQIGLLAILKVNGGAAQTFRYIQAGEFTMGSPVAELERHQDEGPQHRVTISEGFWLADTACTQDLWQALMGANPSHFHARNRGGPNHPVENVSWNMIQAFLKKLQILLPECHVGLPTEAEWEYACRAESHTPFSFGANISTRQVNFNGKFPYADGEMGEYRERTVAVKDLPANAWGLYQMHGNVWEWCADRWRDYAADPVADPGLDDALDPALGDKGAARVLRGGGWFLNARGARSACRSRDEPDGLNHNTGLRLALRSRSPASRPEA